ncbi:uncharacterized protein YALI1_D32462g [Yarrowia lipolytica]|uniref:Uncharacterized protein n=1 Tax=Yarrowia lipolytica TaxID=4952 RepID=A0A1D8NG34_YARLL|nr:hypothetical protein YALI1_D32462g [Yarrowia lipolytica]
MTCHFMIVWTFPPFYPIFPRFFPVFTAFFRPIWLMAGHRNVSENGILTNEENNRCYLDGSKGDSHFYGFFNIFTDFRRFFPSIFRVPHVCYFLVSI